MDNGHFLTVTFNGSLISIFINGNLVNTNTKLPIYTLAKTIRVYNYIGLAPSIYNGLSVSYSYLDDLRFYNKSLSLSEIKILMDSSGKNSKLTEYHRKNLMLNYIFRYIMYIDNK
jgi:hypothetical protein